MSAKSIFFLFLMIICLVLLVSYAFTGSFEFYRLIQLAIKTGTLQIGGKAPIVERIYINDSLTTMTECDPVLYGNCTLECNENGNRTYRINATIYDENGDCASFTNVRAYLCQGSGACNSIVDIYEVPLSSPAQYGLRCNFTGELRGIEYFRRWENWRINVTAFDTQNLPNNTVRNAYYNQKAGLIYPYPTGDTIVLGTITNFDVWSLGLGGNTTKNTGNVRLNVTYNASDFTCAANTIAITGTNYAVGNDTTMNNYMLINDDRYVPVQYFPAGGMRRCGNYPCLADEDGAPNWANYTLYWHINVPTGTPVCTPAYTNSIEVSQYAYTLAG